MSHESALRRLPRPATVTACPICTAPHGMNYATCLSCRDAIERYWLADWEAFISREQIQPSSDEETQFARIVLDEGERHLWSVLDIAMTHLVCGECGSELGGGPPDCTECASAWGVTLWAEALAGRNGLATFNEHALHVGRMILRHPHRQSANIIAAWSRTMPRLLTGWLPSTADAQAFMALIKAGRLEAVDAELAKLDQSISASAEENKKRQGST